ncbi:MMPL family transporter [Kangiella marina]|uniref:MMPL family transporter n=1 Tax=Kangiella marina TaxID=1079178 RepID=A0ABP8IJJ4_9GAMM
MSINRRFVFWLLLVLTVGAGFYAQLQSGFNVQTNILKLLPQTEVDPFAEKAFERFSEQNFKKIIVAIKASDKNTAAESAKTFAQALHNNSLVASLEAQLSSAEQEAVGQLVFNHRFHLLSPQDQLLLCEQGIEPFIDASLQLVYSPLSGQLISLLPDDPYLLSYRYLEHIAATNTADSQREFVDGHLIIHDQSDVYSIVTATLQSSPFDSTTQQQLITTIEQFKHQHPELEVLYTGATFYAQHAAASAKSEISTIGLGSLIGVVLLLIVAFRGIVPLCLTLLSLGTGIFLGFTVTHASFGSIHILTLVFGSSLIGVAVDYAFHYFASANETQKPLHHILGAISFGLISSVIGYAALFTTPFPGLQQMALFCATGLIGAFLTVTLLFDRIPYKVNTPNRLLKVFDALTRASQHLSHKAFIAALCLLPLVAAFYLSNTDSNNDNIRQLQSVPPELYAQEQQLQQLVAAPATNQFFVVKADSTDKLLAKLESVNQDLQTLVDSGAIDDFNHLAQFVPSVMQQQGSYQQLAEHFNSQFLAPFIELGLLTANDAAELQQQFHAQEGQPLTLNQWLASPLGERFSYLWLGQIERQFSAIITLHNIQHIEPLVTLAEQNPTLYFINKVEKVSALFAQYRELSLLMLSIAVAVIFIILALRYGIRIGFFVVFGPIIAASIAILANIAINGSFNLFSALALFLVFGIGIDYGLFYSESKQRSRYIALAIGLSAMTTFLSFGLLSFSDTPAIHAFGVTMLSGILSVFLLSPVLGHQIYQAKGLSRD